MSCHGCIVAAVGPVTDLSNPVPWAVLGHQLLPSLPGAAPHALEPAQELIHMMYVHVDAYV